MEDPIDNNTDDANNGWACCVCGGSSLDGRQMCRFVGTHDDIIAATTTTTQEQDNNNDKENAHVPSETRDLIMHVFCGKTAAILPTVNQPQYEILTAQGIKNKHGNGREVYLALQRSRTSILFNINDENMNDSNNNKKKPYYLVREFEANLTAARDEMSAATFGIANEHDVMADESLQNDRVVLAPLSYSSMGYDPHDTTVIYAQEEAQLPPAKKLKMDDSDLNNTAAAIVSNNNLIHKTPYQAKMDHIAVVMARCHATGYTIVRHIALVQQQPSQLHLSFENFDPHLLRQDQVDTLRVLLFTPQREQQAGVASRLILGNLHGQPPQALQLAMRNNKFFPYQVLEAYKVFCQLYRQHSNNNASLQFDMLLSFTDTLREHSGWIHHHDLGWRGGDVMLAGLAHEWKLILSRSSQELGIDEEFTRPGVMALLQDFKTSVESVATWDDTMQFNYE